MMYCNCRPSFCFPSHLLLREPCFFKIHLWIWVKKKILKLKVLLYVCVFWENSVGACAEDELTQKRFELCSGKIWLLVCSSRTYFSNSYFNSICTIVCDGLCVGSFGIQLNKDILVSETENNLINRDRILCYSSAVTADFSTPDFSSLRLKRFRWLPCSWNALFCLSCRTSSSRH